MALGRKPIEIVLEGKHQLLCKADHWERIYLKEVAKVQNGFAFCSIFFVKAGGLPLIRIRDIEKSSTVDLYNGEYIDDFLVNNGDILVGMDGDFKAAIWTGGKALLNQRVCRIIPNSKTINSKFLFLCLQPFLNAINAETSSVTVKHLSSKTIENIPLPFPPLPEQQAIVAKIEELFSELENGKQQLETALKQLKVYRQSLLKWAFEGKLTNENVENGERPTEWKIVELKTVVDKISDGPFGSNLKSADYLNQGIRVIRLENIGEMEFRNQYQTFVSMEKYETIKNHTVRHGDIIFSSFISESIRAAILPSYIEIAINKADCFLVRICESKINRKYLAYYFSTQEMRDQLVNHVHGATRPRINTTQLKGALIPLPTLHEQQHIVNELESRLTVCDKIEETITKSLKQAETLRQSILKKAFEGKLVIVDDSIPSLN